MRVVFGEEPIGPDALANVVAAELYYLAADLEPSNPWATKFLRCAAILIEPGPSNEHLVETANETGGAEIVPLFK